MRTCPHCHATTRQNKAGKTKAGAQRYLCLHCNNTYIVPLEPQSEVASAQEQTLEIPVSGTVTVPIAATPMQELQSTLVPVEVPVTAAPTRHSNEEKGFLTRVFDWTGTSNQWGWLPEIAVLQSAFLLMLAFAFVGRRAAAGSSQLFSWISLATLILLIAYRLASAAPARRERLGLVLLLGMSLYLVKVMYSPMAFVFPDELSHLRNVNEILQTHRLFHENPVLPVTAFYPGLAIITSTLASLSGLSPFSAGILVIGAARLTLFLALFLLFERVSGSSRVAGLATLLYMANPNFLYWTSEFAYEPLALPMLVFVLMAVAKRGMATDRRHHRAWTIAATLGLLTVVITHHMSSYILTGLLIALVIFYRIRSGGTKWGPWDLALVAVGATSFWLIFVASFTLEYLSPVLGGAFRSMFGLIAEEEQSRELFKSGSTGRPAPVWEQVVTVISVLLVASGLPFGVWETWKKHSEKVFALLLAAIALVYFPMQALRFTKAGWETANRSSEFLFIGIGFVLAIGIVRFGLMRWPGWKSQSVMAVLAVVLVFGGLIAGWPPRARWPRPYVVAAGNHLIRPQVVTVSEWVLNTLGPDNRIAASKADAKLLNAYGQYPFTDTASSVKKMFLSPAFGQSERHTLLKRDIQYVISDSKEISWDHMIGYYFYNQQYGTSSELESYDPRLVQKFDKLEGVVRLMDAGDIVVYDVRNYLAGFNEDGDAIGSVP